MLLLQYNNNYKKEGCPIKYLAHISEDGRKQTIQSHLIGTAALCREFASAFNAEELGFLTGLAHDIGKYSEAFQRRLLGGAKVDHATAGACECAKLGQYAAAFAIVGHHGGLPDGGGRGDSPQESTFQGRMKRGMSGMLEPYNIWNQEISLPNASMPSFCRRDPLSAVFFTRMLYSCLVDADYLDTEAFMQNHPRPSNNTVDMKTLLERLQDYISDWFPPKGELNRKRCAILTHCLQQGSTLSPNLFTLTVPTGGGKTVSSLAFALAHAKKNHLCRIIYVIPYTSIIEQTANKFRDILGSECVLEHHSSVDYDLDNDSEISNEKQTHLLATENWDMPVIVTTAVQFFESLYSNRSSRCRKLHNLANSIVIFDEAQMMPIPYLRPCVHAISQLVAHYNTTAVLCTATQPALTPIFKEFLPSHNVLELCPAGLAEDPVFLRTSFRRAGTLSWDQLAEQMKKHIQALCIVNSRKNALTLYNKLCGEGCYHLSTLMTPSHRRTLLAEIRQRLDDELPCLVVSTSLIEAGVDVDFPAVFREEAGLDSILQAAGRCNREGNQPVDTSIVTIFRAEDRPPALFETTIGVGRIVMEKHTNLYSTEAIQDYFQQLIEFKGQTALDQKGILAQLQDGSMPFRSVAEQFHLIENNTHIVYIPFGEGISLIEQFQQGDHSQSLYRQLNQYGVCVYETHFRSLVESGALKCLEDGSAILQIPQLYKETVGLSLHPESGWAEFV